jgi:ubiquinol-cytochrome c reductase subunit 8
MRGAYKHWAVNGAKRLGQQAVYFAVPFGLGESTLCLSLPLCLVPEI